MKTDVVLPGEQYIVHQWKAGEGSFVSKGDVVALVRDKNSTVQAAAVKTHMRPSKRGRKPPPTEASRNDHPPKAAEQLTSIMAPATGLLTKLNAVALTIGSISPCTHPAVIDKMCAVCGTPMDPGGQDSTMKNVMSGGITMKVSETEAMSISQSQTVRLFEQKKLSLVLDLDHTLVHATADPRAAPHEDRDDVRTLLLPTDKAHQQMHHRVKLRPHLKDFLTQQNFEITVYTAGTRLYAEQITMILSRHVVGSQLDHIDILRLQNRVKQAEKKFMGQSQKTNGSLTEDTKPAAASTSDDKKPEATKETCKSGDDKKRDREPEGVEEPPRKRVRFGEVAADMKTDVTGITQEEMDKLRKELKEALAHEKEALEMRQKIFGSRIVSRSDVGDLGPDVKSLKRIFPCGGTMSIICDDREDVWANAKECNREPPHNLLLVQPYHWKPFTGFADVNNSAGADLSKGSGNEDSRADNKVETDKQLLWTTDILDRVHARYYSQGGKVTVPDILKAMRKEILQGCRLILSGLVPLHKQQDDYKGPRHPLLRYPQTLGAKILSSVGPSLTHVVAAADGTEKIMQARRIPGCYIVKSSWLMECVWSLKRSREMDHLVGAPPRAARVSQSAVVREGINGSTATTNSTDDDDDDDDDFAEGLWDE